jgi:hypothetical protein
LFFSGFALAGRPPRPGRRACPGMRTLREKELKFFGIFSESEPGSKKQAFAAMNFPFEAAQNLH